ncbi:DUF11 domain-containing protein [Rudanella paleaurantiibacter]|uniref:DUF11 domain-containing protein n=1 Tax=Rudanella paleaurantiibacter TaxID=2614655 RepID=A0A7J5U1T5_9BACT|nr:sialate O-acetylesterase [Rudanella paleaurantiibacter]KAB7731646.1 DUF11 domain-containing protein [Rudanella paleaurantiibacter]
MSRYFQKLLLYLIWFIPVVGYAQQFEVSYPVSRLVVQRGADNQGQLYVSGRLDFTADRIEGQLTPVAAGQGNGTAWQVIQTNPQNGVFYGQLTGTGGWYVLNLRAIRNNIVINETSVRPVGIGEVFITAGQSNSRGLGNGDNDLGTATDRVSTIDTINHYYPANQPLFSSGDPMPFPRYKALTAARRMFPMGESSWGWGELGDYIVSRYNVPVVFYNAGWDSSTIENWINTANGIPACNRYWCSGYWLNLQPYTNLKNILHYYGSTGGARAVLWHQGEAEYGDNSSGSIPQYATRLRELIAKSRADFNGRPLPWVIARASFDGQVTRPEVVAKQQEVIDTPNLLAFQGPLNDTIINRRAGVSDVHFGNELRPPTHPQYFNNPNSIPASMGLSRFARNWNNSLNNAFFQTATPVLPQQFAVTGSVAGIIAPADSVSLAVYTIGTFGGDNGWQVQLLDSSGRSIEALPGVGTNPVRTKLPSDLTTGWFRLRLVATNPVLPAVPTNKFQLGTPPPPPPAPRTDLSLAMVTSSRVVRVGETLTVQLILQNSGPDSATNVQVQNRLPANLSVVTTGGLTNTGTALVGSVAQLGAGASTTLSFGVRVLAEGTYRNAAEITQSSPTDSDSQPGTGTSTGQDDEASVEWRTPGAGGAVFESANPNQIQLPAVQPNEPTPDPDRADLSLQLVTNTRAPALNELVSYSLVVSNRGGASATAVSVAAVLPAGLSYVSGLSATGQTVTGTISSLNVGSSTTLVFVARLTATGEQLTKAQITAATPADSDSTPGNGTENGEDDTAWLSVRGR